MPFTERGPSPSEWDVRPNPPPPHVIVNMNVDNTNYVG